MGLDISKIIPSRENTARLLQELNGKNVCIMCETLRATMANNSLCSPCWADCEGENNDHED